MSNPVFVCLKCGHLHKAVYADNFRECLRCGWKRPSAVEAGPKGER